MRSAISKSAARSTYTWQLPVKCLMTGIVASAATRRIKLSPPRGIATSISSCKARKCPTASRSGVFTICTHRPAIAAASSACRSRSTIAWLLLAASLPPRRITALPLVTQMAAASAVTFGRDS